jgi:hypothetical protein
VTTPTASFSKAVPGQFRWWLERIRRFTFMANTSTFTAFMAEDLALGHGNV